MLHHLIGATIQMANLVNYNCHPKDLSEKKNLALEGGRFLKKKKRITGLSLVKSV